MQVSQTIWGGGGPMAPPGPSVEPPLALGELQQLEHGQKLAWLDFKSNNTGHEG